MDTIVEIGCCFDTAEEHRQPSGALFRHLPDFPLHVACHSLWPIRMPLSLTVRYAALQRHTRVRCSHVGEDAAD